MSKAITIRMTEKGDFQKSFKFLKAMREKMFLRSLNKYGQMGVDALAAATPKRTGLTANSWHYEIVNYSDNVTLRWYNTNVNKDWYNVALMIQYGHGTGTGGWVEGIDYINPALKPVFDKIAKSIWIEIQNS